MAFIHRIDKTNVGDLLCAPYLYTDAFRGPAYDIFDTGMDLSRERIVIVGGGGLGRKFFGKALRRLADPQRPYRLVAWGVGADTVIDKSGAPLDPQADYDLYSDFFEGFDEVGIRSWSADQRYRWVPCASSLHVLFDRYRDHRPRRGVGFYQHKHSRFSGHDGHGDTMTNNGSDFEAKLAFLADHEVIVSNTYHGVYWATLLNRKVLCLPFKSGLFSFRHQPAYIATLIPSGDDLHRARSHPDSLEECRAANLSFRDHLLNRFSVA